MRGRWGFFLDSPWVYVLGLVGAAILAFRGWELWSVGYLPLPSSLPGSRWQRPAWRWSGAGVGFSLPRRY